MAELRKIGERKWILKDGDETWMIQNELSNRFDGAKVIKSNPLESVYPIDEEESAEVNVNINVSGMKEIEELKELVEDLRKYERRVKPWLGFGDDTDAN